MYYRLLLCILFLTGWHAVAQVPQKFNYQAVVRNNNGNIIANQQISIRFSIHDASASGPVQYRETHAAATNAFGLVNLQVGAGIVVTGSMMGITWNSGGKFLEIEIDVNAGTSYVPLATLELAAVPYALHAGTTGSFTGTLAGEVNGPQQATVIGNNAVTTTKIADNNVTTAKLAGFSVTGPKLAEDAVTTPKITDLAVGTAKIADAAVTGVKLADGAVTAIKVTDQSITTVKLADNAVGSTKIADNAVITSKLAGGAVTNTKIADAAITATKLATDAVTTAAITDNAITATKIANGAVVKSLNGIKDDITLVGSGGTNVNVSGNTITIQGSAGSITGVTAGAGLTGGGASGNISLGASFGGDGTSNTVSRTDHTHIGQTWSTSTGYILRMNDNDNNATPLSINCYPTGFSNAALSAQVLNTTGQSVAVFGNTVSNDGFAAGVFGQAYGNGQAKGVWGLAHGANTFGIFGQAAGVGSWAGYFEGRVHVNGTLSKAAGSFRIDHPLDPVNKTLSHSFVESPDMMNVYNGNILLDANGEATVTLPDYFEALNRDFRYQLTAIGKPSPGIYIAEEINGNRFKIAGGAPGGKISWMVTGIRQDPYAKQHPIVVEEQKTGAERGAYLYPEGYGQSSRKKSPVRKMELPVQEKGKQ